MTQNEKESVLKSMRVYPSTEIYDDKGLTFYQSLILNLSRNPDITNKKDQSESSIAHHIKAVADKLIELMT